MQNEKPIVVLKFGSSVLRNESDLPTIVHEIYRWWREGHQVVVVVSAFGETTNELTRRAHTVCEQPAEHLVAALLATGESASSALLGLALNRAGIPACVLTAEQAGLATVGPTLDANLVSVDGSGVLRTLQQGVVVLPGFVGLGESGETTLLGRGGSDLTALFLAQQLGATCRLVKDVDGLYTSDPNAKTRLPAYRFARVSYKTANRVGGVVVQPKAIEFAERHRLRFVVSSIGADSETEVGPFSDRIAVTETAARPLRVALLGCGTVGSGVYSRLAELPHLFEVIGVGTRNVDRAIQEDVPVRLITTKLDRLIEERVDVVIELLGGLEPARSLISRALSLGREVVTANKALLATHGPELEKLATDNFTTLRYSAAVGGATPILETIRIARRVGELESIAGVVNGTTNFILDEIAKGESFADAVKLAQTLGYAEADPRLDLDSTDAAQKLILLARAAFDTNLPFASVRRKGIDEATLVQCGGDSMVRVVAECRRSESGFEATVGPVELAVDHPFAGVHGVENRLLIKFSNGRTWSVSGRGAGRWPTTEAVVADLFDLRRQLIESASADQVEECVA